MWGCYWGWDAQYVGDINELVKKARTSSASVLKEEPALRKQALEKYLEANPDVKHNMAAAKNIFFEKYGHAPKSDKQNKEYADLMQKYVGHVDIDVKKILGNGAVEQARTQKKHIAPATFTRKQDKLNKAVLNKAVLNKAVEHKREQAAKRAASKAKRQQAHVAASKPKHHHANDDAGVLDHADDAGVLDHVAAVKMSSQMMRKNEAGVSKQTIGKMKTLKSYEKTHKNFAGNIEKVHMAWAKLHSGPPKSADEQTEYAALLKSIVGDVDVKHSAKPKNQVSSFVKRLYMFMSVHINVYVSSIVEGLLLCQPLNTHTFDTHTHLV